MAKEQRKFKVITKIKLCNFLINKGFQFVETRVDYKCPTRFVWVFPYDNKLEEAISEYYSQIL